MLNLNGNSSNAYCDRVSRRDFLTVGSLTLGGLSLAGLLRAEARAGSQATGKSIINIYLGGGPTHLDTFDLKPKAPSEFRGEFQPIETSSPGMQICELFPQLARRGEQFSVVRSISDMNNEHAPTQSDSGWSTRSLENIGGRPGIGAVMSKLWGQSQETPHGAVPTSVDLTGWTKPGFLGQVNGGFRPTGEGQANLTLNSQISAGRLDDRQALLGGLDRFRRDVDSHGMMSAMDSFHERAVGIVTSGKLAKALDLKNEDPRHVERYGIGRDRYANENNRFVLARRLVQAGARCVAFSWGGWDTHSNNFTTMRQMLPRLDVALAALIDDLDAHGLLDSTIIMMSGEFGRTPRINGTAGRDHWPRASFVFLAGGGMRHGQMIGSTTRNGEEPQDRPIPLHNVFHTVYHQLGIDTNQITLTDPSGRPQYLVDDRQLISELI